MRQILQVLHKHHGADSSTAPLAGCRGAGFAGPLACPLEGEARSASGVGSTVYSTAVSRNRKRMSPGTSRPFTRLFTPTMVFRLYSGSSSAWSAT